MKPEHSYVSKARSYAAFVLVALALGACASTQGEGPQSRSASEPQIDWKNPIGGVPTQTLAAADESLPFKVVQPSGLGEPTGIFVTPPEDPPDLRVLQIIYETADFGEVVVLEGPPDVDPSAWDAVQKELVAQQASDPEAHGTFETITLPNGKGTAIISTSEDKTVSDISWLEGEVQFTVEGPSLNKDQVLKIASAV